MNTVEVRYLDVILVLRGVSLEVSPGKIVALLGANGAGKSTVLKAISGLLETEEGKVTDGSIYFNDTRIDRMSPEDIVRLGIVQVIEGRRVMEHLTTEQNLRGGAYLRHGDLKRDLDMVYSYFPKLKELRHATAGYLSGGEQQMLVMGRAMMAHPKLMLLDEPSMGLAPLLTKEIFNMTQRFSSEEKTAMLIVEQNARAALSIAEHGYIMENGRVVLDAAAAKLADNPDVKEFYLGLSTVGEKKSYREVKHYRRRKRWLA
jgi:branched-chain amino acid transport system ATP-binding protein